MENTIAWPSDNADLNRFFFTVKEVTGGGICSPFHYYVTCGGQHIQSWHTMFSALRKMKDTGEVPLVLKEKYVPLELVCLDACARVLRNVLVLDGLVLVIRKEGETKKVIVYGKEEEAQIIEVERVMDRYIFISSYNKQKRLVGKSEDVSSKARFTFINEENEKEFDRKGNRSSLSENGSSKGTIKKECCFFQSLKDSLCFDMSMEEFEILIAERIVDDINLEFGLRDAVPIDKAVSKPILANINEQVEMFSTYQSSSWQFNCETDVDLRTFEDLSNKQIHEQRVKALNMALTKINIHLNKWSLACPKVDPSFFEANKFDTILIRGGHGSTILGMFPTAMERTFEVFKKGETEDIQLNLRFTVKISLHNPASSDEGKGPCGPHVRYSVTHQCSKPTSVEGNILLNRRGNEDLPDFSRSRDYDRKYQCVPLTRLFSLPSSTNFYLQRADNVNAAKIRQRRYPPVDF